VTSVSAGSNGSQAVVHGLGLEHATISFGGTATQVVSATATSAIVTVPGGSGTVTVAASSSLGTGTQSSTYSYGPTIPAFPTFGQYPEWLPANYSISNVDHSEGSDTTLFMMESISNLYAQAGLFPFSCLENGGGGGVANQSCNQPTVAVPNPNNSQSDPADNFAATEELQGINDVGSGNGQKELCGTINDPPTGQPDYSRSSKPISAITGCPMVQLGYAKDSVPSVDFLHIDPEQYGTPTGYDAIGSFTSYTAATGAAVSTPFPTGGIGPVAAGWLPGDAYNCSANLPGNSAPFCSGTPFTDVDNTGGLTSVALRLWCTAGSVPVADESQITDWGNLTNLSAAANGGTAATVGNGAPIGVPIRIIGVNSGSGTAATFNSFAASGLSGNCSSAAGTGDYNVTAAGGANPITTQPGNTSANLEVALENDASQIGDFANANWGPTDAADQATDIATSLYFEGYGPYGTNPTAGEASLEVNSGVVASGLPTTFTESLMTLNGVTASIAHERSNAFPTSRTLFNIYRSDTVRASTAGFLNWLCDTNPGQGAGLSGQVEKGTDHVLGGNFDGDITNIINGQYGFSRLTDATAELPVASQTPADGIVNPNGSCEAQQTIAASGITVGNTTVTLSAAVPASVQDGWTVTIPVGYSVALPASTTISSISGSTITLSNAPIAGTGGTAPGTLYFPGHPPVLAVGNANT
jgi:hypothetical protein